MFKYLFMKIALRIYKNIFIISLNIYFLQDKVVYKAVSLDYSNQNKR